jgi:extradiol dioxygenase family protein
VNHQGALVTGTDFVFLPITSFERAEEFYGGVLGSRDARSDQAVFEDFDGNNLILHHRYAPQE